MRFMSAHPATRANIEEVKREEKKLNVSSLVKRALKKIEIFNV